MSLPILYSFRRCPYAIRARMALAYAGISYELREVSLKNKPQEILKNSKTKLGYFLKTQLRINSQPHKISKTSKKSYFFKTTVEK